MCVSFKLGPTRSQWSLWDTFILLIKCLYYKFSKVQVQKGAFIYLTMTMQYVSVVVRLKCHCNICTQKSWVYFVHLHIPLKTQLAAKDSQTINRQSSMWAEITLDNDDNKRIEENKDRGEREEEGLGEAEEMGWGHEMLKH